MCNGTPTLVIIRTDFAKNVITFLSQNANSTACVSCCLLNGSAQPAFLKKNGGLCICHLSVNQKKSLTCCFCRKSKQSNGLMGITGLRQILCLKAWPSLFLYWIPMKSFSYSKPAERRPAARRGNRSSPIITGRIKIPHNAQGPDRTSGRQDG